METPSMKGDTSKKRTIAELTDSLFMFSRFGQRVLYHYNILW